MVRKAKPVVVWSIRATEQFRRICEYILESSPVNAEKVKAGIAQIIDNLPDNPEKFSPDKFKRTNKGNYRAFEKYSLRIAYKSTAKEISILRIRHIKQEPKEY